MPAVTHRDDRFKREDKYQSAKAKVAVSEKCLGESVQGRRQQHLARGVGKSAAKVA